MININLGKLPKDIEEAEELAEMIVNLMNGYDNCVYHEEKNNGNVHITMKTNFAKVEWDESISPSTLSA